MAIIYSYPQYAPKPEDLLIGTVTLDENAVVPIYDNPTVSFTVQSLLDMIAPITGAQNLQQVTNIGATTSNAVTFTSDIKVTGRFYDSSGSPGLAGQVLSSTVTGTSWIVNSPASVTSVGLTMPAAFTVANSPITTAGVLTVTGAGTAAQYINGLGNLVTFPTIPTPYVLPVATTIALGGIKIGYTEAGKNYPLELSNEQAFVNVPWTDTIYTLPLAADGIRGGVQIGYTENAKNYPVELSSEKMFVNVPWTDTPYVLPVATASDLGGVKIGYTENAKNYPVELSSDQMFVNVPWTDTQNPFQTITGTGSDNTDSGVLLSNSGGTVLILGAGSVAASQTGNTITLTGTNTDTGITGVTLATADSAGAPLVESIANRELTLTSAKYIGGANVGYVPEGGTGTTYLKGDGTWASIPTGLQFKGTWDASGGGGGNPNLTLAGNKGAGFLWICDVAGTAYPNGGSNPPSTWALGDWCVYDGTAWTRVPATNAGVTSLTTTDGTFIDLTPNTATTGAVTVTADLSAQDGTSDTNTKFLSKDNTWDVPSYTTDTNTQNIYTNSWQASTNDIILRKVLSGAGSGTQDIKIVKGANITFTYTDADNFTIAATDTQENTTWYIRDSADADKTVNNLKYLKFVTATGTLGTALTGAGSTGDPYIMTLTSPDTNTQNTYTAGAGLSVSNFVFSADIDTTAASSATNSLSTDSTRYYAVQLDNNSTAADRKMVVNVPWSSGGTYSWKVRDNASTPVNKTLSSGEFLQFKTATGTLATGLAGAGTTTDPYVMTLTSPNDNDNTLYTLAGAASSTAGEYDLVLSADGTAQNTMVFKQGSNVTFTRASNSLTIAAANDNDNTTYDFLAVQTGNPASNDDPALRLDPSTGSNDDVTLTGGSNMTITRNSDTEITFDATNTWLANTKTVAGYVAAPGAVASKVWKTDASGNPGWRDDDTGSNTTYSIDVPAATTNINLKGANPTSNDAIALTASTGISITRNNADQLTFANTSPDTGVPAILSNGSAPSLNTGITGAEVRTLIDAQQIGEQGYNTITVTVVNTGSEGNKYYLDGYRQINAQIKPGFTYRFDQSDSSNSSHPLAFKDYAGNAYTTGVTTVGTPGSAGAYTQIIPTQQTNNLTYYCTNHTGMGSTVSTGTGEVFVDWTNVANPGKLTLKSNIQSTLQLRSEDVALAANEIIGAIEFYGSDGTNPGAGVKSSILARNGDQVGGTGNKSNLIFAVSPGSGFNNTEAMRINPTGSIAIDGATKYGSSGQILTSAGDAPPTWENPPVNGVTSVAASTAGDALDVGGTPITSTGTLAFTWAGADTEYIDGEGNLVTFPNIPQGTVTSVATGNGIGGGTITTTGTLTVGAGNGLSQSADGLLMSGSYTGTFTATGDLVAYSDERLKSNVKTLDGSKVYDMHGVSFNKDDKKGSGVIAQELEKVAPELIYNEGEYKAVAYGNISGYLIEAIKDLKAEIEELKNKPCNCNNCNCNK